MPIMTPAGIVQIAVQFVADISAAVIHQNAGFSALGTRRIPSVLIPGIGKAGPVPDPPGATPIPQAGAKLRMQFHVRAVPEFPNGGRLLVVVFTETEEDVVRIISARRATTRERKNYEEGK